MIIIDPIELGLVGTNVPVDPTQGYDPNISYGLEIEVQHNNKIWVSAITGNLGTTPGTDDSKWVYKKMVNPLAWSDTKINTQVINPENITLTFVKEQKHTYLALFGLEARSVTVTIKDPNSIVTHTETLSTSYRKTWSWSSFFSDKEIFKKGQSFKLPYTGVNYTIEISIDNPTKDAKLGGLVLGSPIFVGHTLWKSTSKIIDYTKKIIDIFGNTEVIKGFFAKVFDATVVFDTEYYDMVNALLINRRGELTVFVADDRDMSIEAYYAYGFFEDYTMTLDNPNTSTLKIKVQGVT